MTMIHDGPRPDERHPGHVDGACDDPACAGVRDGRRRPGRPRSEAAERAILDAVLGLLSEGVPYGALSMEQVATRAGVGKATVYRRWPNKESLVVDSMATLWQECPPPDLSDDRSTRERIVEYLDTMVEIMHEDMAGLVFASVMAAAQLHPELVQKYQQVAIEPRREQLRMILRHGIAAGELRADLDVELGVRMFAGPIVHTMKAEHPGRPVDDAFVRALVDTLLEGIGAR
ncbi:AcrR family transcriptional regulator [Catenulispora sp. GAS73]|uniref:TetR/AcrR family transcriptional regulator n=1 Tax=Catenulispora sp. GAS73 TaxID=3156269 RepID=UPI003515EBF1